MYGMELYGLFKDIYKSLESFTRNQFIVTDFEKGNEKRQEKDIFQAMPFVPSKFCAMCASIIQKSNPFLPPLLLLLPPLHFLLLLLFFKTIS